MEWLLTHYLTAVAVLFPVMGLAWVIYLITQNPGVVDVFWALGIVALATVWGLSQSDFTWPQWVLLAMVGLWGLRLGLFLLLTRVARNKKEERYLDLAHGWKKKIHLKFLANFLFQAFLQSLLVWALLLLSGAPPVSPSPSGSLLILSLTLFVVGWMGETLADFQLYHFKKNPEHRDRVCDVGLWGLSRHPNYFFEWVVWTAMGLWSFAFLPFPLAWMVFIAPLTLLYIFFGLTISLTENQALKRRQSYAAYQNRVSVFIPWFQKKEEK